MLLSILLGGCYTDSANCFPQRENRDGYVPKIVALYMPPSVEYLVSVLSVLRCGEAFLPLDPSWPKERILSIVSSSNVQLLIVSESSFSQINLHGVDGSRMDFECSSAPVLRISMEECIKEKVMLVNPVWPCEVGQRRKFCYLMYTSGSTGKPKGVYGTEEGKIHFCKLNWDACRSLCISDKKMSSFSSTVPLTVIFKFMTMSA